MFDKIEKIYKFSLFLICKKKITKNIYIFKDHKKTVPLNALPHSS